MIPADTDLLIAGVLLVIFTAAAFVVTVRSILAEARVSHLPEDEHDGIGGPAAIDMIREQRP